MAQENKFIRSLIQSAQNGNNAALEQLFEMNLPRVFGLCFRILGIRENAESITVLVFIEAWKQIKFIRPDISFTEWLCSMAVWNSLELIRAGKNTSKSENKKKKKDRKEPEQHHLKLNELDEVIIALPDKERLPIVLYKIEGYRENETCDLLSIKSKALNAGLQSASEEIRKKISKLNSADELSKQLSELPKEIIPASNLMKIIFDEIYELKIEELEKNKQPEPEPEPEPEQERETEEVKKVKKKKPEKKKEYRATWLKTYLFTSVPTFKKVLIIVIPLIVIAAIFYFVVHTSPSSWNVTDVSGNVQINGKVLKGDGSFSINDILNTGNDSKAIIEVSGFGTINLMPDSRIERTNKSEDCIFNYGEVKVSTDNDDIFTMIVPGAEIKDYHKGNTYTLKTLSDGRIILEVISGWVEVRDKNFSTILPGNYFVYLSESTGCGLPCARNSSAVVKELLNEYSDQSNSESVSNSLLNSAVQSEAITLWNVLPRLNILNRGPVFEKLNELIGTPEKVTKDGTINLDGRMMNLWLKHIEETLH